MVYIGYCYDKEINKSAYGYVEEHSYIREFKKIPYSPSEGYYTALIYSLEKILEKVKKQSLEDKVIRIYSNFDLLVDQLNGFVAVKKNREYFNKAKELIRKIENYGVNIKVELLEKGKVHPLKKYL